MPVSAASLTNLEKFLTLVTGRSHWIGSVLVTLTGSLTTSAGRIHSRRMLAHALPLPPLGDEPHSFIGHPAQPPSSSLPWGFSACSLAARSVSSLANA